MTLLLKSSKILQRISLVHINPAVLYSGAVGHVPKIPSPIGNREVVGYGSNGTENYADRVDFPMPAIRFRASNPSIQALREKEKGDWKKLSLEEKKQLYRASFCQTFAEVTAPTGEWKSIIGTSLGFIAIAIWCYMGLKMFVYDELPETFSLERRQAQLQRMIDISMDPIQGISSKWDYEKGDWKK